MNRRSNGVKNGFALITVLAVLIMIALGTATILQSIGSQTSMKSINLQEARDQYIAEAGMQYALWCLRAGVALPASHNVLAADGITVLGTAFIRNAGGTICVGVGSACA